MAYPKGWGRDQIREIPIRGLPNRIPIYGKGWGS